MMTFLLVVHILLALALFFSSGVALLFQVFPLAILGVILFLTGAQLALGSSVLPADKNERYITLATAALCMWNVAAGFVAGLLLHWMAKRRWIRM